MIVECPRCRARYRVEEELLERDQTFKCSRCTHIFAYEADASAPTMSVKPLEAPRAPRIESPPPPVPRSTVEAETDDEGEDHDEPAPRIAIPPPPPAPPPPAPQAESAPPKPAPEEAPPKRPRSSESLSFSFSRPDEREEQLRIEEEQRKLVERRRAAADPHEFSFGDDGDEEEPQYHDDEGDAAIADQPRFVRGQSEVRFREQQAASPTRSYFVFLVVLVLGYAILALDLRNHPARAEKLLASVPLVGDSIAQDQLLQIKVHLEDVEAVYQQLKDDHSVFIVSGRAVNTSNEALKGVQIESVLYDPAGQQVAVKNIYCGNAMSLKIVKDLSSKEISLLQRLEPPKRFEIRPGEPASFSVVFLAPPAGVKEFSVRVVSAQAA